MHRRGRRSTPRGCRTLNGLYFFAIASISSIIFLPLMVDACAARGAVEARPERGPPVLREQRIRCRNGRRAIFFHPASLVIFFRARASIRATPRRARRSGAMSDARSDARAAESATGTSQEQRFALELEFVMALANPRYLHRACPTLNPLRLPRPRSRHAGARRLTDVAPALTRVLPFSRRHADLAKEKYLDDPAFVAYLEYLRYWERPEYARFIHYPHALFFLDQLQRKEFRRAMANPRAVEHVFSQQFYHWQKFRTERLAAAHATDATAA